LPGQPLPAPGCRVRISFGAQTLVGIVIATDSEHELPLEKIKPILEILDQSPHLDPPLLALYNFACTYYLYPLGLGLLASLPRAFREGKPLQGRMTEVWQLSETGRALDPQALAKAQQQSRTWSLLHGYGQLSAAELSALLSRPARPLLQALAEKGLVTSTTVTEAIPRETSLKERPLALNAGQQAAFDAICSHDKGFNCFLLEGITGSGKTEIYLQLIHRVILQGQQALVLVPEISLTPQTLRRFSQRFNCRFESFHSGLSDSQRQEVWLAAGKGEADIIIGTRSAVFMPLANPGIIIIDEEHDDSYKQQEGFRYNARDLAVWRARQMKIPVLLGSATPSLESLHNALQGRYHRLHLPDRAGQAVTPRMRLVDLRQQKTEEGLAPTVIEEIRQKLHNSEQVLVFLNRRGYSPVLLCEDCGWIAECKRCESSYTLHQQPAGLRCHHCEASRPLPRQCGACGSSRLNAQGQGTERTEAALNQWFPDFPVIRIDRDSTRRQDSLEEKLSQADSGIPCILVGTQMLAKGHHFPRVSLVVIVDADSGLFSADFRAHENLGQLLIQVAGRAGRSERPGTVLIQTWHPEHPSLRQLLDHGYGSFARNLLDEREAAHLPPCSRLILVRAEASRQPLTLELLSMARQLLAEQQVNGVSLYGPMPSPIGKRAGRFRAQMMLLSTSRHKLHKLGSFLANALEQLPQARAVRWQIDVDPVDFS
jgi:primosomal protein N' (replication factor Y)